jgi:RHS repeat-associated protein
VASSDGSTRLQLYSQAGQILWATSSGGPRPAGSTAYIYLGGKQIAEEGPSGKQFVHTDALGSPVAHTNASGGLMNRTRFEPFGFTAAGTKPGPNTSSIGFTGHVNDPETDLVYMQQRYYDPIAGRFLSVDPIVTDANTGKGFGLYTYVDNNPYAKVDPDGRAPCTTDSNGCVHHGTPQSTGTPGHDSASQKMGAAASNLGAKEVHYNRPLSAVTGDSRAGNFRPDVSVVWKDGSVSTVEVVSGSQTVASQEAKGQTMQTKLGEIGRSGTANTVTVGQAMAGATVRATGALSVLSAVVRALDIGKIERQTGGAVPFGVGLGYLAGHVDREQVVNAARGGEAN